MTAGVENAPRFINSLNIDAELLFEDVKFLVERKGLTTEQPRTTEGGAPNHDGIDAVAVESSIGLSNGMDIAIANNGNVDAGIALHLANERPVGLARIHLTAGATVDGQRLDAAIL